MDKKFSFSGLGNKTFIIAELSGNHLQNLNNAKELIKIAYNSGADAVKIQTYTPDTISINPFGVGEDIVKKYHIVKLNHPDWKGMKYNELYEKVYTPWDWHLELEKEAIKYNLHFFSTPNDFTAVDFLEEKNIPFYKIASYDLINIPLLKKVGKTGKPAIISVGMGTGEEINEAIGTLEKNGCPEIVILHCVSSYPTKIEDLNLSKIKDLKKKYPNYLIGFSDHSLDIDVPAMAVGLGAKVIERHLCLGRKFSGPDSSFSSEPEEFERFVEKIRNIENSNKNLEELKKEFPNLEKAYGKPLYGPTNDFEISGVNARPSIWINKDIQNGEIITQEHLKIVRPGNGLKPKYYEKIIGKIINRDAFKGEPFSSKMLN
jgi:pseudaminic acid synthase